MEIYLRTRGRPRELDYRFLGEAPDEFWWRSYSQVTDIERPTVLVRSNGTSWQAYVAGIRSRRLDASENGIAFNLALAGECGPEDDNALALGIISRSVASLAEQHGLFIPGDPLDGQLPEDEVHRMLAAEGKETAAAAGAAVRAAYDPYDRPEAAESPFPSADEWIGGLANPQARNTFTALTARLLAGGQAGRAFLLNLVADQSDLDGLPGGDGDLGVLSALPGPKLGAGVQPLGKAQPPSAGQAAKEIPRPRASRPRSRRPVSPKAVLIAAGVVVGVVIAVILIEVLRQPPTH